MSTIPTEALVAQLRWRYAVKKFDPARRIDAATWRALEETLVLTPSSYGIQPWRFVVVEDADVRAKLRPASWNQPQVTDASHYVVFAYRADLGEADVDRWVRRTAEVRGVPEETLAGFRRMLVGGIVRGMDTARRDHWAALQVYIALGSFMTAAALVGVDTCPMEGIEPAKYDEVLGLPAQGFRTVCACAAGYRAADDRAASLPKVRFPHDDVVRRMGTEQTC